MFNTKRKESKKKEASNLYNAFTLWLTSIFAIPVVVTVLVGFSLSGFITQRDVEYVALIASMVALIPGTIYACQFLNNNYFVKDKRKIVFFAAIIALFAYFIFVVVQIQWLVDDAIRLPTREILTSSPFYLSLLGFLAKVSIFAIVSNNHLEEDK